MTCVLFAHRDCEYCVPRLRAGFPALLSVVMAENVQALRAWAQERAVPAD